MPSLTFARIAELTGGRVVQGADLVSRSVVIDSREAGADSAFFAIRGVRHDGHDFLADVYRQGSGAVVERVPVIAPARGIVRVADTTRALQDLARGVRASMAATVVAVTGSAGKTTTKDMIATLASTERRTFKSWGNFNNHIGCPLCLANVPDDAEVLVLELGMSAKGEIAFLASIARPDVGVYTSIAPVHLEFFASIDDIAVAKRELMEGLSPDGTVVINADDPRVAAIGDAYKGRTVRYGIGRGDCDVSARSIRSEGLRGSRVVIEAEETAHEVSVPLAGRHNVENFLAAVATARVLGVGWEGIEAGTSMIRPGAHRGVVIPWRGATLYDDTYNSNPAALRRTFEMLAATPCQGRRIVVVGDMLELGADELAFHRQAAWDLPGDVALVVGVGQRSRSFLEGAAEAGIDRSRLHGFDQALEAVPFLRDAVRPGDLVLLKASRGVGLDRVVAALESEG